MADGRIVMSHLRQVKNTLQDSRLQNWASDE